MNITTSSPRNYIKQAVKEYVDLIKTTYGPVGKQVLIVDQSVKSVDDGKMASQDFEIENEFQNAVIRYIKEVTDKTEKRVGDGTTTSVILMGSLVEQLLPDFDSMSLATQDVNVPRETENIKKAVKEAISHIEKHSKKIKTEKELYDVVLNSCNNQSMAKTISATLFKLGANGALSVEESRGMDTEVVFTEGLEIERGYTSPYFINKGMDVELENPKIIVCDSKLDNLPELAPAVKSIIETGTNNIVIVADDFSDELINFFVVNKLRGMVNPLLLKAPGYGELKSKYIKDIAILTGATVVDKAHPIKDFNVEMAGSADLVRSKKDSTLFIGGKGKKSDITAHIKSIQAEDSHLPMDKERNERRIAQLTDGVAVLKIGAPTENEMKTLKAKAEDAVNAGKVALKGGIVGGGGMTLASIETSSKILNEALKAPRKQLEENGKEFLDSKTFDPALVQIAALETAVSIALGLVNTGGIITVKREEKENKGF